ncbi:MAG: thiol reductase thioredoxin [Bacilli bacterium]|nr:thiol reductase thioredoxin [Bacilli bacterium]
MKFYKFYADWCGPCKVLTKNLEKAGIDYEPINIEENEELCATYGIRNIPVFVAVKEVDGVENEVNRFVGIKTPEAIKEWVNSLNG